MKPKAVLGPVETERDENNWIVSYRRHGGYFSISRSTLEEARSDLAEFVHVLNQLSSHVVKELSRKSFKNEPAVAVNFVKSSVRKHLREVYPMISLREVSKEMKNLAILQGGDIQLNLTDIVKKIHKLSDKPWPVKAS